MSDERAREIVGKLTGAQKRWLLDAKVIWRDADTTLWATFPPSNTCRVLYRLKLWQWDGCILPLGLAVRRILEEGNNAQG